MINDDQKNFLANQANADIPDTGLDATETVDPHADLVGRAIEYLARYKPDMDHLQQLREKLHNAYMSHPYGNEMEGRSKIVMSDVADTVEWIMPSLMRIFFGGPDVCKISPQGEEDIAGADLLNEKVNHDFTRGFNGYLLLYDWFRDALVDKMGVVKYWWENVVEFTPKKHQGLTDPELTSLLGGTRFQLDKQETTTGPDGMPSHNVMGREVHSYSRPMAEVLPPEELIFDLKAKSLKTAEFVAHRKRVHKTEVMRKYDVTEDQVQFSGGKESFSTDPLFYARFQDLGGVGFYQDDVDPDWLFIHECYLNDYSEGYAKPMQVVLLANKAIHVEENSYGKPPFCEISPIRVPHRAIGRSLAELVIDLQQLKTALARFIMDNIYYQNNAQKVINPFRVRLEDAQNNNYPGGLIRTKQDVDATTAIWPVPVSPLPSHVFGMLETVESWKENRTGVTKYNQGTDADTLNKTATGISAIMSASQQRVELIARNFAETGVKDLFYAIAEMNTKHLNEPAAILLNEKFVTINQQTINVDFDVNVDVALGTGTRDQQVQHLLAMLDRLIQPPYIQSGVFLPENLYNLLSNAFQQMGIKNVDQYLTHPPTPEQIAAQQAMQQQQQQAQMQQQGGMPPNGPPQMVQQGANPGPTNGSGPFG
jgi:hypothetical protein